MLLVVQVLNVYKPQGLTPYGWRKQQEERRRPDSLRVRAAVEPAGPGAKETGLEDRR